MRVHNSARGPATRGSHFCSSIDSYRIFSYGFRVFRATSLSEPRNVTFFIVPARFIDFSTAGRNFPRETSGINRTRQRENGPRHEVDSSVTILDTGAQKRLVLVPRLGEPTQPSIIRKLKLRCSNALIGQVSRNSK